MNSTGKVITSNSVLKHVTRLTDETYKQAIDTLNTKGVWGNPRIIKTGANPFSLSINLTITYAKGRIKWRLLVAYTKFIILNWECANIL